MDAYDKTSIQINRCKRILALVDTYVETETASARTDLRKALMEEFEAPAIDPPVAAGSVDTHEFLKQLENYVCTETLGPLVAYIDAWGAQQREAGWIAGRINGARVFENTESAVLAAAERLLRDTVIRAEKAEANEIRLQQLVIEAQDRAEKAEARVKELERALSNGTAKPSLLNSASTLGNNEQS